MGGGFALNSVFFIPKCHSHTVKKANDSSAPAGMSQTELSLAGKNFIIPGQGQFG
jgi:hypothetical protein